MKNTEKLIDLMEELKSGFELELGPIMRKVDSTFNENKYKIEFEKPKTEEEMINFGIDFDNTDHQELVLTFDQETKTVDALAEIYKLKAEILKTEINLLKND